jgi:hypothetical protein
LGTHCSILEKMCNTLHNMCNGSHIYSADFIDVLF